MLEYASTHPRHAARAHQARGHWASAASRNSLSATARIAYAGRISPSPSPTPLDFLPRIASLSPPPPPPPPPEAVQVLVPRRPRAHSSRLDEPRQAAAASPPQPGRFQELRKKRWPAGPAGGGAVALLRAMIVGLPGTRRWSRACGQGRPRSEPEAEASCGPAFTPSAFNAGSRDCTV